MDVATGNGDVAFAVAGHQPEARVSGADIADQAISRNQTAAKEQVRADIEFRLADRRKINFPDATFDGITWRYALHHFADVEATLADARRVLGPAGAFVVADAVRRS